MYKEYALQQCNRYWKGVSEPIKKLPIPEIKNSFCISLPPEILFIELPEWAKELGDIPIPKEALVREKVCYENVDWFFVIFWYLNSFAEREWEKQKEPIHSYSTHLKNWNPILWEKAWVNRICLFLRRYASVYYIKKESELLGDKPNYTFLLTHDIDAIHKTFSIRIKQSIFQWYNSFRLLRAGEWTLSLQKFFQGLRFFFSKEDYYQNFLDLLLILKESNIKSVFHFYSQLPQRRNFTSLLIDPSYKIDGKLKETIFYLERQGHKIGIHPSYEAFNDTESFQKQIQQFFLWFHKPIEYCRQHWLRFSFRDTWKMQDSLGIKIDTTLGFNDRIAFRNGAAMSFQPLDLDSNHTLDLRSIPMLMMDSHFYDYNLMTESEITSEMKRWLDEVKFVGGEVSILWHSHTIGEDYGWKKGFIALLDQIT